MTFPGYSGAAGRAGGVVIWVACLLAGLGFLSDATLAAGSGLIPKLTAGPVARVVEIVDGDTVILDNDMEVRLTGIQAPKLPLGRRNFKTWPLAGEAKQAIAGFCLNKRVQLFYDGRRMDRHGRVLAHLQVTGTTAAARSFQGDAKTWVQGHTVASGFARVYSFRDNRRATRALLELEIAARRQRRNIWRHPFYRIRQADRLAPYHNTFQLIEGRIKNAALIRGRLYLNFGRNWRNDFTIVVHPRDRKLFDAAGLGPAQYQGRLVRVRGWLGRRNGPTVTASHPEQIELLPE